MLTDAPAPGEPGFELRVARLVEAAGGRGPVRLLPLRGGYNNRVFRVESNTDAFLLKAYFPSGPRDRLGAEFSFCRFAWTHDVRCVPRPLACDPADRLGLFEFVDGRPLRTDEVTEARVQDALDFYHAVNAHRSDPDGQGLPNASESCFSIAEQLQCVERRLRHLQSLRADSDVEAEAAHFVAHEMVPAWTRTRETAIRNARRLGLDPDAPVAPDGRRISPSDFGFHNALLDERGRLRFIDFEYAGWDDPAKMTCDFFCQPEIPVPLAHLDRVIRSVGRDVPDAGGFPDRVMSMLPACRLKWCCIMLNDFLPVGGDRRRYAAGGEPPAARQARQLAKARNALRTLE